MAKKSDFKTVNSEMNLEEINAQVRKHRRKLARRGIIVVAVFLLFAAGFHLWSAMRSYSSYEIQSSVKRFGSESAGFVEFGKKVVEYSNDGVRCWGMGGELTWNQSYEMDSPTVDVCDDYLIIFDKGGTQLLVMTSAGMEKKIETSHPIKKGCVASQGTSAILMEEGDVSYVNLYDRQGKELASGQFYGSKGGYPADIALSFNARKLAVDMIDVGEGTIKSVISFYNFGSVGQNEIDNNVGSYSFEDVFIPRIDFVTDDRLLALGDSKYIIFEGKEKPSIAREVELEDNITSVFYNRNYIGVTTQNPDTEHPYHLHVYDMKGVTVMENDTTIQYDSVEFLTNGEICVRNDAACEIFTRRGIRKYSGSFDHVLCYVMPNGGLRDYVLVFEDTTEEVRLK